MVSPSSAWPTLPSGSPSSCPSRPLYLFLLNLFLPNSDDAFKTLLHTAPPGKRDYYNSIRQAIQKYRRNKECSRFWLFSLRDGAFFSSFLPFPSPVLPLPLLTDSFRRPLGAHVVVRPQPQVGVLLLFVLFSHPSTLVSSVSLLFIVSFCAPYPSVSITLL
jgi:hypothetical protein